VVSGLGTYSCGPEVECCVTRRSRSAPLSIEARKVQPKGIQLPHDSGDDMTERRFNLPMDADSVPEDAFGIYAFRLSLPSDARLGLTAKNADPKSHAEELLRRSHRLKLAIGESPLVGQVGTQQAPYLSQTFKMTADPLVQSFHTDSLAALIAELGGDMSAVRTAASVLRYTMDLSLPLYVGMTAKQSFRQRLDQHMSGNSQFSERLKVLKIAWSDLQFVIRPLEVPRGSVLTAERLAQSLLRPRVSVA
jgi:hypothetical protein